MIKEAVNHPEHYNKHPSGIECIEVIRHFNFNLGNVIKYIWRAPYKGVSLEDLKKAEFYLKDEIERVEKEQTPILIETITHINHCYQGEYEDSCKYGVENCPARPKYEFVKCPINSVGEKTAGGYIKNDK